MAANPLHAYPSAFDAFVDYAPQTEYTQQHQQLLAQQAQALTQQQQQQQQQQQYKQSVQHQQQNLDFFSFADPTALEAPQPEEFDTDLDFGLAQVDQSQLELFAVDSSQPYEFLRSDTPTHQYRQPGPGSTFSDSQSGYGSLSNYSESIYQPQSEYVTSASQRHSFTLPFDMDITRIALAPPAQRPSPPLDNGLGHVHRNSFSTSGSGLSPSPPQTQLIPVVEASYRHRSSSGYSDYAPPMRGARSDYGYPGYTMPRPTHPSLQRPVQVGGRNSPPSVSPSSTTSSTDQSGLSMPITPPVPHMQVPRIAGEPQRGGDDDPRRKYKCPSCPRSFARAFNLKTHMATHDPNRPKPHVCPHKACARSFSRKHDLGRHLVSIHRDEHGMAHASQGIAAGSPAGSVVGSVRSERGVGVNKDARSWCDLCGKGWVGHSGACNCRDIK